MFWSAVLPLQITCGVLAVACAAGVSVAPRLGVRRRTAGLLAPAAAVPAFVPLCLGVGVVCDAVRFGELRYAAANEVAAPEVARWLPDAATDIHAHRYAGGFEARYTIGKADLLAWLDAEWARWGDGAVETRIPPDWDRPESGASRFRWADWTIPADAVFLDGPHARNAAGFGILYSPSEGRAYQEAGYW